MPSLITNEYRIQNANNFIESFSEASPDNAYFFIAKNHEWSGTAPGEWAGTSTESAPQIALDSRRAEISHWEDILALKKLQTTDISRVIARNDWTSGVVYEQYDDQVDDLPNGTNGFYVRSSADRVYKCISNNGGNATTGGNEPTGTSTGITSTGDGYEWQFMYEISASKAVKFMTDDWIPVETDSNVQAAAVNGEIDHIEIDVAGSGYAISDAINFSGDGTGLAATVSSVDGGGEITGINISTRGSGYTRATVTSITTGGGSGATLRPIISPEGGHGSDAVSELGGFFVMVNVAFQDDESGDFLTDDEFRKVGIVLNPKVTAVTVASGTATISGGSVTGVDVSGGNVGNGYHVAPIISFTGGDGNGALGSIDYSDLTDAGASGKIPSGTPSAGITIDNGGTGYTVAPTVRFIGGDDPTTSGSNATANTYNMEEIRPFKGKITYIQNRVKVQRAADQSETVQLVLQF